MIAVLAILLVAVCAVAGAVVVARTSIAAVQHAERQHARERQLLVNQLCSLAGRPWQTAPADEPGLEPDEPEWDGLTGSPDQWTGDEL